MKDQITTIEGAKQAIVDNFPCSPDPNHKITVDDIGRKKGWDVIPIRGAVLVICTVFPEFGSYSRCVKNNQ